MFHVKQFTTPLLSSFRDASPETREKLQIYINLIHTWQSKINLISSSTLPHLWERHFQDSLQLLLYLPKEKIRLLDLGSGAGFPGLVLAIAREENLDVTLVESDLRKCLFLENVSRETKLCVKILRSRIESLTCLKADVITARALAPLSLLLEYGFPLMEEHSFCLFLKGKEGEKELELVKKKWQFQLEIFPSMTDSKGQILKISHLERTLKDV